MRKLTILTIVITITIIGIVFALSNVKATNKSRQETPRITKGEDNPGAIPDHAAQEAFLRSLTATSDDEVGQRRARAFAKQALGEGAEDSQVEALLSAAQHFVERTATLDQQVKEIKDVHWPRPSSAVMAQLAEMQRQKEANVREALTLFTEGVKAESKDKVHKHITERVKRNITTATPTLPDHPNHQHGLGMIVGKIIGFIMPAVSAQSMGGNYTYSNTSYNNNTAEIYGYGGIKRIV
ncbi:MAG: hypothetical protein M3R15_02950 [Acidobacteriota bacterium]|nr:hypothetical protein [Acidobacteriota bacterium]